MIESSFQKGKSHRGILLASAITLISIAIFFAIDSIFIEVTFAPLFCAILLFLLSLAFRPLPMVAAASFCLVYVVFSLLASPRFDPSSNASHIRVAVRTLTFGVAGGVAVLSSYFRNQLLEMLSQTRDLLSALPVPVILSNDEERIVWANNSARATLGTLPPAGRLFLESLPSDGTPIDYRRLFTDSTYDATVQAIVPDYRLRFVRMRLGRKALLVTVLLPKGETPILT